MSDLTSVTLLSRLRSGTEDADWARFTKIYAPLLESWLRRRGIPRDVADDVQQEVLKKVFEEIGKFEHNGRTGAFRTWIRAIMTHRLRTIERRRWKEGETARPDWSSVADQLGRDDSELSRIWNKEHDAYLVQRLLDLVDSQFQSETIIAFRRVVLNGEDAMTVAGDLGMTVNAVRIAQSRVLRSLKTLGAGILD